MYIIYDTKLTIFYTMSNILYIIFDNFSFSGNDLRLKH